MNTEMSAAVQFEGAAMSAGLGRSALALIVTLGMTTALAFVNGGYDATSWGWSAVALLWVAGLVIALSADMQLSRLEVAALLGFTGVLTWTLLSNLWTLSPTRSVLDGERALVYVSGLVTLLLIGRRTNYGTLLVGVWAATALVCAYSLLTRLFPNRLGVIDPVAGYRLSEPIGYWNGLGVFAAVGALLALGLAARARSTAFRAVAAASLLCLIPTIYFTFSRGAWIALGLGLAATIVLDLRRLQFLATVVALLPSTALAVVLAYRSPALSRVQPSPHEAAVAGHRLAFWIILLAAVNAIAAIVLVFAEQRTNVSGRARKVFASLLAALLLAGLGVVFANFGSPVTIARNGWDAFAAPPPAVTGSLNKRLFSLSGSGRLPQWRVAVRQFEQNPWVGSGAGTYELYWQRYRPFVGQVRDAHNLYLETLGELGVVGLALLVVGLAPPLYAAVRARGRALVPAALGGYIAYLTHAIVDWDWELAAVTFAALACGAAILVAARSDTAAGLVSTRIRVSGVALTLPFVVFAVVGLVGNEATGSAKSAASRGDWRRVATKTRTAHRWAPWSAVPLQLRAEAELAQGRLTVAQRDFKRAVAKDSHDWSLWFELAQASNGAARRQALREARRLNPRSPEIAEYIAANPIVGAQP
jgi:hypothetical protein